MRGVVVCVCITQACAMLNSHSGLHSTHGSYRVLWSKPCTASVAATGAVHSMHSSRRFAAAQGSLQQCVAGLRCSGVSAGALPVERLRAAGSRAALHMGRSHRVYLWVVLLPTDPTWCCVVSHSTWRRPIQRGGGVAVHVRVSMFLLLWGG